MGDFKILALQTPEFKILADFKILLFQNAEFNIFADLEILVFQNAEFKIYAYLKILADFQDFSFPKSCKIQPDFKILAI